MGGGSSSEVPCSFHVTFHALSSLVGLSGSAPLCVILSFSLLGSFFRVGWFMTSSRALMFVSSGRSIDLCDFVQVTPSVFLLYSIRVGGNVQMGGHGVQRGGLT